MNKEAMLEVAVVIEHFGRFNLSYPATFAKYEDRQNNNWSTPQPTQLWEDCGTVGCVWGWTNAWAGHDQVDSTSAAEELGLTEDEKQHLFYAETGSIWVRLADEYGWEVEMFDDEHAELSHWSDVTAPQAADVIRRIARGEVTL